MGKLRLRKTEDFRMGGMARLLLADIGNGRKAVYRHLQEQFRFDWSIRRKFRNGIKIRAKIRRHPQVVWSYERGMRSLLPYEIIDYVNGPSLQQMLVTDGEYVRRHGSRLLLQMAEALRHVHRNGYLHLDIKPGNFLIDITDARTPEARLTDFDLALPLKQIKPDKKLRYGTFNFMAPEHLAEGRIGVESDVFAFGVMAYNMYTGKMPYGGDNANESRRCKVDPHYEVPSLAEACPEELPKKLCDLVGHCLERQLHLRYSSMDLVVRDLLTVAALAQLPPDEKTRTYDMF